MIYIVDEEKHSMKPFRVELEIRGYDVEVLRNADTAYDVLSKGTKDMDLAIIDVMLSARSARDESRFSRSKTDDFMKTGLLLLEYLIQAQPEIFPRRAVFFSMATDSHLVATIKSAANGYGIPYLNKADYESAMRFGEEIQTILKQLT